MVDAKNDEFNDAGEQPTKRRRGIFGVRRSGRNQKPDIEATPSGLDVSVQDLTAQKTLQQSEPVESDMNSAAEANLTDGDKNSKAKSAVEKPAKPKSKKTVATSLPDSFEQSLPGSTKENPKKSKSKHEKKAKSDALSNTPAEALNVNDQIQPIVANTTTSLIFRAPPALAKAPPRAAVTNESGEEPSSIRRRTRRRGIEDATQAGDIPDTVVKVRKPRVVEQISEPQKVKGSTRLEAKKQRRRDGRDAGRRRAVVTEAEFLARREAVDRVMVVRQKETSTQIGVLEDGVLVEHYVARSQDASLIGNIYLGRVQNVLPSMEAAFVDIGRGRNAVLYSGEVDWDSAATAVSEKNQPRRIELALKTGDKVLVQVTKDPVGHKGARLTSQISLPGRYLVYVPNGAMNGISRKLPDTERARLKKILKEVLPENQGVIVRTAAEGATEEQLTLDVNRLVSLWENISTNVAKVQAPALLHAEPDLLIKIVRDVFNEDFQRMVIAGDEASRTITNYLGQVAVDLLERVDAYTDQKDIFESFRVTEQIEKALDRKVWLPSGGSLVIDRTEAMTVIDVNTGKFIGAGGNLEETVTKNNLEAAEEIARQLRLRDIGGIVVVDFIDMVLESNRDLVLRRLIECLSRDRTKHQVAEVTSLGLVQMTRKKIGLGLLETFSEACEICAGRGVVVHHEPVLRNRNSQPVERRRNRAQSTSAEENTSNRPHAITEDAKNALAMIAASTIVTGGSENQPGSLEMSTTDDNIGETAKHRITVELPEHLHHKRVSTADFSETAHMLDTVLDALHPHEQPNVLAADKLAKSAPKNSNKTRSARKRVDASSDGESDAATSAEDSDTTLQKNIHNQSSEGGYDGTEQGLQQPSAAAPKARIKRRRVTTEALTPGSRNSHA